MSWGQNWLQLKEKKSIENQKRLMSWYRKRKPTWRKDLIRYNSHPWIMFYFNWLVIIWRGGVFVWNWTSKVKGAEEFWTWLDKRGGGSWKLENFHGRHMCVVPKIWIIMNRVSTLFCKYPSTENVFCENNCSPRRAL